MRPTPTVPVSTTKPWVKARRLIWGPGHLAEVVLRRGPGPVRSRRIAAPAPSRPGSGRGLSAPVGSGSGFPSRRSLSGSPFLELIRRSELRRGPMRFFQSQALKETSGVRDFRRGEPLRIPRGDGSKRPSFLFRPDSSHPASRPSAPKSFRGSVSPKALVPPDCRRGKWVRLPPRASSLRACPFPLPSRLYPCEFRLLFSSLCLEAASRLRSVAPRHVLKLTQFPIRAKRNRPVDK